MAQEHQSRANDTEPNFTYDPASLVQEITAKSQKLVEYAARKELADIMARAGLFPGVTDKYKAMAIIEMGRYFGMEETEALLNIQIGVQGAPSVHYSWKLKRLRQLGHDYDVLEHDHRHCKILFKRKEHGQAVRTHEVEMSVEQASKIAIKDKEQGTGAKLGTKWNWKNYPKSMVLAFCVNNGIRWYFPEVMGGMVESDEQVAIDMAESGITEGPVITQERAATNINDTFGDEEKGTDFNAMRDKCQELQTLITSEERKHNLTMQMRRAYLDHAYGSENLTDRDENELREILDLVRNAKEMAYALETSDNPSDVAIEQLALTDTTAAEQKAGEPW